jgi:hypothetical protein
MVDLELLLMMITPGVCSLQTCFTPNFSIFVIKLEEIIVINTFFLVLSSTVRIGILYKQSLVGLTPEVSETDS